MTEGTIQDYEVWLRFGGFGGIFLVMATWEVLAARRELQASKGSRWFANLGMVVVDTIVVRLLFPAAAVGMALTAERFEWGLLRQIAVPEWLAVVVSIVLLDLVIYFQHVMFHAVPALWRIHMVHHADVDIDVTTGLRFHPIEIVLSMVLKLAAVSAIGAPVLAVLLFEVILNGLAMFNHANARLPLGLDRVLRLVIVTPDMHRVHHSVDRAEHDMNFGFNLSLWDRLMGTYKAQPSAGHEGMTIGLPAFRDAKWRSLPRLLAMPFSRAESDDRRRAGLGPTPGADGDELG